MKYAIVLAAAVSLGGCAAMTPLEELEQRAMLTGDWSQVEAREQIIARRAARQGPSCPQGRVAVCRKRIGETHCACVHSDAMSEMFGRY